MQSRFKDSAQNRWRSAKQPLPWCVTGCGRRAQRGWYRSPEDKIDLCFHCWHRSVAEHMPTYQTFAQVDVKLRHGTYVRIQGNPEPYYDGVYKISKGNNCQGFTWGNRIFPGPYRLWGLQGNRPRELRPWGDDMPPGYSIPGYDD